MKNTPKTPQEIREIFWLFHSRLSHLCATLRGASSLTFQSQKIETGLFYIAQPQHSI